MELLEKQYPGRKTDKVMRQTMFLISRLMHLFQEGKVPYFQLMQNFYFA